jgi:hypothetical protein
MESGTSLRLARSDEPHSISRTRRIAPLLPPNPPGNDRYPEQGHFTFTLYASEGRCYRMFIGGDYILVMASLLRKTVSFRGLVDRYSIRR